MVLSNQSRSAIAIDGRTLVVGVETLAIGSQALGGDIVLRILDNGTLEEVAQLQPSAVDGTRCGSRRIIDCRCHRRFCRC